MILRYINSVFTFTLDIVGHVAVRLAICGFLKVVSCNHIARLWRCKVSKIWGHDHDLSESRGVIDHVTFELAVVLSYNWSIETTALSHMVVEILLVKHLATHFSIESVSIQFCRVNGKLMVKVFLGFCAYCSPWDTYFELLTVAIGPRASLLCY